MQKAKRLKVAAIAAITIDYEITSNLFLEYSSVYQFASCLTSTQQHLAILNTYY